MGRRKKRTTDGAFTGPETNVFGQFASAAIEFARRQREALEQIEHSDELSEKHKEEAKESLAALLDQQVEALCARSHEALDAQSLTAPIHGTPPVDGMRSGALRSRRRKGRPASAIATESKQVEGSNDNHEFGRDMKRPGA